MLSIDRDALICDLAETYHILDYRALPVTLLATLACGLREHSRIRMKMAGLNYVSPVFMIASIADNISAIQYGMFAKKNTKKPQMYCDLINDTAEKQVKVDRFRSGEDFLRAIGQPINGG